MCFLSACHSALHFFSEMRVFLGGVAASLSGRVLSLCTFFFKMGSERSQTSCHPLLRHPDHTLFDVPL